MVVPDDPCFDPFDFRVPLGARGPAWVRSSRQQGIEEAAFLSGAMLAHLHMVQACPDLPQALWRDRLALRAAESGVRASGRPERAAELRDAIHLLRPGDLPGPAGEVYLSWRRAIERPVAVRALQRALREKDAGGIARWLDAGQAAQGGPVGQAAQVLETVLAEVPRAETTALILADAVLAQALGWGVVVPVLALGLTRRDLRQSGAGLRLACHGAVTRAGAEAVRLAADLTQRAARLQSVTPKLRAKGAAQAVEMFLSRDVVAPSALPLPDRAARRLCDRLVALGAIREVTGRDTFRLYGV